MAKFLIKGSYSVEGARGLIKEGGSGRRAAAQKALESLGARVEAFYFALGEADVYVICDAPDLTSALALSMTVNSLGGVRITTTQLLSAEEVDAAAKKSVAYRAPGA